MGEIVAFPIGTRHVAVERVAREIYQQTKDYKEQMDIALGRASTMYARALKAGVPETVAHEQAKHLAGMLGEWIDTFEWEESQGQLGGDGA